MAELIKDESDMSSLFFQTLFTKFWYKENKDVCELPAAHQAKMHVLLEMKENMKDIKRNYTLSSTEQASLAEIRSLVADHIIYDCEFQNPIDIYKQVVDIVTEASKEPSKLHPGSVEFLSNLKSSANESYDHEIEMRVLQNEHQANGETDDEDDILEAESTPTEENKSSDSAKSTFTSLIERWIVLENETKYPFWEERVEKLGLVNQQSDWKDVFVFVHKAVSRSTNNPSVVRETKNFFLNKVNLTEVLNCDELQPPTKDIIGFILAENGLIPVYQQQLSRMNALASKLYELDKQTKTESWQARLKVLHIQPFRKVSN